MKFSFISVILLLLFQLSSVLNAKSEIAGYPIFGYENETGFYAGAIAYIRHNPINSQNNVPPNNYYISMEYSEKKQFQIKFEPEIHFCNDLYSLYSSLIFRKWPTKFYGISRDAHIDKAENFTPHEFRATLEARRTLTRNWDLSLVYDLSHNKISELDEHGMLITDTIPGSKGGFDSGLGLEISYDSRNSESYPVSGELLSFRVMKYSEALGSDYNFDQYSFDLRKYISFSDIHILALQGYISFTSGNPPFYSMPHLDKYMRGLTPNLHIDKQIAVLRSEYRCFPWDLGFFRKVGFVVFAEAGQVAHSINNFSLASIETDFGFGLRYSFFTDDRLNLRIDVGFGEENWNFSISTGEAF